MQENSLNMRMSCMFHKDRNFEKLRGIYGLEEEEEETEKEKEEYEEKEEKKKLSSKVVKKLMACEITQTGCQNVGILIFFS